MRNVNAIAAAVLTAAALAQGAGCDVTRVQPAPSSPPAEGVLATVNGEPIYEEDVRLALARSGVSEPTPAQRRNVLEVIARKELLAQRADALGLDESAAVRRTVREAQAQADAIRREALSDQYVMREVVAVEVTDAEAKAWYDAHAADLGTEVRVKQILRRSRAEIEADAAKLAAGAPFDDVAAERFPGAGNKAPWDLGYLRWTRVQEAWRAPLASLTPGAVSPVIEGPNGRFWILQLVDRRAAETTFEDEKAGIVEALKKERVDARRAELDAELKGAAEIVILEGTNGS
ncbi:MAG: peptidyl-prolyl cis-trans isomerase [Myxococcota bacterium]